jgi:hypothetical protein
MNKMFVIREHLRSQSNYGIMGDLHSAKPINGGEAASGRSGQAKQQGELQPEFQAMMDRFRGELLQMQKYSKTLIFRVIPP